MLTQNPGDVPVILEMQLGDRVVRIAAQDNLKIHPELAASIKGLLGEGSVRERYLGAGG